MTDQNDTEAASAMSPVAVFVNRFYLSAGPERVRIAFAEVGPNGANYRLAISLSPANAKALSEVLRSLVNPTAEFGPTAASGGAGLH